MIHLDKCDQQVNCLHWIISTHNLYKRRRSDTLQFFCVVLLCSQGLFHPVKGHELEIDLLWGRLFPVLANRMVDFSVQFTSWTIYSTDLGRNMQNFADHCEILPDLFQNLHYFAEVCNLYSTVSMVLYPSPEIALKPNQTKFKTPWKLALWTLNRMQSPYFSQALHFLPSGSINKISLFCCLSVQGRISIRSVQTSVSLASRPISFQICTLWHDLHRSVSNNTLRGEDELCTW